MKRLKGKQAKKGTPSDRRAHWCSKCKRSFPKFEMADVLTCVACFVPRFGK